MISTRARRGIKRIVYPGQEFPKADPPRQSRGATR